MRGASRCAAQSHAHPEPRAPSHSALAAQPPVHSPPCVPRTAHRSVLLGLVMAGLEPEWVMPSRDVETGLPLGLTAEDLLATLRRLREERAGSSSDDGDHASWPVPVAVLCTNPTYCGGCVDVGDLAEAAHDHGLLLVVDQAWGAHFGFHPSLPPHALMARPGFEGGRRSSRTADAMITSLHKNLCGFSQAALLCTANHEQSPSSSPSRRLPMPVHCARATWWSKTAGALSRGNH